MWLRGNMTRSEATDGRMLTKEGAVKLVHQQRRCAHIYPLSRGVWRLSKIVAKVNGCWSNSIFIVRLQKG